ncbi:MAG TPA: protein kinase [Thermoanaerobaculia bacterium]|nr:protein kinase [Thermoanaerobaculia bacterium]
MTLVPGTRLATYEITALLGAGGMGEVYRAHDDRLGRDVALKVLAPRLTSNHDAVARFEQEARSASALSHPHILHIYDVGTANDTRYMVMELVDGETLAAKIRDSRVTLEQILGWLAQVADGLAKAHEHGIVHRDLKPDNIMITRDGYAKLLDFGLAKLVEPPVLPDDVTVAGSGPRTTPGIIMGTVAYMSPEQAQGRATDARSDIFSFGCILYEAAARRRPFDGASTVDTLHRVIYSEPDYAPLADGLAAIVRKCLAKDPEARYASIREVPRELRAMPVTGAVATVPAPATNVIAVLPFDDLSPGRDNEYFAEGLAEEITSDLSRIRSLRVLSRGATRQYRGDDKDVRRVATELGAVYVIDGGVRKAGQQLRITAQLIDARSLEQLWSEKYSGTVDDVFDIQEKVARSVVEQLQIQLTPRENAALAKRSMSNVAAWECYQRARMQLLRFDEQGLNAALKEIENGLAIAGPNVALRAAEGYVYWQYYNAGIRPDPAYIEKAATIARDILAQEPDSPHGHRLMGMVALQQQHVEEAVRHLEKVLTREPNDADALMYLGFLGFVRRRINAPAYAERLVTIDPVGPLTQLLLSFVALNEGRAADALPFAERAHGVGDAIYGYFHVQVLAVLGRIDEASAVADAMREKAPDDFFAALAVALTRAAADDKDAMREALTEEVLHAARADLQYSSWVAEVYALANEPDLGVEWLDHAIARGYTAWEYFARHDRLLDNLRGDARFAALLERARREWES